MSITTDELWQILQNNIPETKPIFYRAYYDEYGSVIYYTMEDLPGNYIDIDAETYHRGSPTARVVNGQLVETKTYPKLKPNGAGTACAPDDVCIVVDVNHSHVKWSLS